MNTVKSRKKRAGVFFFLALATFLIWENTENMVEAKTVQGSVSAKSVKVGKRIRVSSKTEGVSFSSGNSVIASVDSTGFITGKKPGKVTIYLKKSGFAKKSFRITVKKNAKKPASLPVTFAEISTKEGDSSLKVTNRAKKAVVKKIVYTYTISVDGSSGAILKADAASASAVVDDSVSGGAITSPAVSESQSPVATPSPTASPQSTPAPDSTKQTEQDSTNVTTVTFTYTAKNIAPGKSVKATRSGYPDKEQNVVGTPKLKKVELYSGNAKYVYNATKKSYSFQWATKDTVAPKFHGLIKGNSVSGHGDVYRVWYSDKKGQYNFKQFVSATDNRDKKVSVTADTGKINWNKSGIYKIYYHAKDSAGNKATTWAKVQVIVPGSPESAADQVLRSITGSGWSDVKKARAIYNYVRGHMAYVHNAAHIQWRSAGLKALRYQSGDCYTYYATCRLLLTRAGIPNIMINRYPVPNGQRHFWNLTYVGGGWYHFDTTPRTRGGKFCLWTDSQLWAYSSGYTFRFNRSLYPSRATKRIS